MAASGSQNPEVQAQRLARIIHELPMEERRGAVLAVPCRSSSETSEIIRVGIAPLRDAKGEFGY